MNRLPSKLLIQLGIDSCKISLVCLPLIFFSIKTKSPLSVGRISRSSRVTSCLRANPSAALVGFPSLKAAFTGGPFITSSRSFCCSGSPEINMASRLGVP